MLTGMLTRRLFSRKRNMRARLLSQGRLYLMLSRPSMRFYPSMIVMGDVDLASLAAVSETLCHQLPIMKTVFSGTTREARSLYFR
jgi:hypothetical protein